MFWTKAFAAASASPTAAVSAAASAGASATPSATATPVPTPTLAPPSPIPTSAAAISQAFQDWIKNTFSLGLWGTVIYTSIVAAIAYIIIKLMQRTIKRKLDGNLRIFYRLLYVIVIVVAVISVITTITPLRDLGNAILASSGIASVIVGLAAQESLANLFSGISIAVAKPFIVGDYIEILGTSPPVMGTVVELTLRSTVIRDASNKDIVVPNSVIDGDMIRTAGYHSQHDSSAKSGSSDEQSARTAPAPVTNFLDVGVSYSADVHKAMDIMAKLVQEQPQFVDTRTAQQKAEGAPVVTVRCTDLAASSVNLRANVPTHTVADGYLVLSNLRLLVLDKFNAEGIEIPYPYENVILQNAYPPQQSDSPAAASAPADKGR